MTTPRISTVDDIIRNWFPIVGILFVVAGMSYLFYEGIWQKLNPTGRLTLGFICGVALISGSYALEKAAKIIADAILAGGLLMLYVTLIFGSRFETAEQHALIPEAWALLIATLFTVSVAFFSYTRKSQYVLLVGIFGGYMTPFFIGQGGQFASFIQDDVALRYDVPLLAFLIYFLAINVAILFIATKFFLKGIGLLNSFGLFIGTASLSYLMGGEFPEHATQLALFSIAVLGLHIAAMCLNADRFEQEADPYLVAGYLLPLAWFATMLNAFIEPNLPQPAAAAFLFGAAVIYFAGWHFLRQAMDRQQHTALYLGGIVALVMAVIKLQPYLKHYDGLIFTAVAFIFGLLYFLRPVRQREMAFFLFAGFGVLLTLWHLPAMAMPDLWFLTGETIAVSLAVAPFILGGRLPYRQDEDKTLRSLRALGCYLAMGTIATLLFVDLIRMEDLPRSLLFLTIPAAIVAYAGFVTENDFNKVKLTKFALALAAGGFLTTLLEIIGRFYPFPAHVRLLASPESFMGTATLVLILLLRHNLQRLEARIGEKLHQVFGPLWRFFLVFSLYTVLWATVTHEIMALFNLPAIDLEKESIRGIRGFATTLWWVVLAAWMIFLGVRNSAMENQKNIGFGLLALTIFKILFIDLYNINTNLKVFIFLTVGFLMLAISFMANRRQTAREEEAGGENP